MSQRATKLQSVIDGLQQLGSQKRRTFPSKLSADQQRATLAKKFEKLDLEVFERIYRKRYAGYSDISWKIEAVKMAKSGNYYLAEIARCLDKSPAHVCQMFKRVMEAPPLRPAWRSKPNNRGRFIIVEGRGYILPTAEGAIDGSRSDASASAEHAANGSGASILSIQDHEPRLERSLRPRGSEIHGHVASAEHIEAP